MAIFVDIFARLHERDLRKQTDNLINQFDQAGIASTERFGSAFEKGMSRQNPKIQRAMNNVQNSIESANDAMRNYMRVQSSAKASADDLSKAEERLARATRAEADAHRSVASAIRQHSKDHDVLIRSSDLRVA
jgi:DNA repair ATPase RecN